MKKSIVNWPVLLLVICLPLSGQAQQPAKDFTIQATLVEVKEHRGVQDVLIGVHRMDDPGVSDFRGFHANTTLNCAACHTAAGGDAQFELWKDTFDELGTWTHSTNNVQLLASPALPVNNGETGRIDMRSENEVEYFVKRQDSYELKKDHVEAGVTFSANVSVEGQVVTLDPVEISIRSITGRESLEGTSLDIGKPVIETVSKETSRTIRLDETCVISIDSPGGSRLFFSFRLVPNEDR